MYDSIVFIVALVVQLQFVYTYPKFVCLCYIKIGMLFNACFPSQFDLDLQDNKPKYCPCFILPIYIHIFRIFWKVASQFIMTI